MPGWQAGTRGGGSVDQIEFGGTKDLSNVSGGIDSVFGLAGGGGVGEGHAGIQGISFMLVARCSAFAICRPRADAKCDLCQNSIVRSRTTDNRA